MKVNCIHKNIHTLRRKQNWSQQELADKCGIDRTVISKWERKIGGREPDLEMLIKLSQLFDCTLDELVLGEQEKSHDIYHDFENKLNDILCHIEEIKTSTNTLPRESIWKQYRIKESSYTFSEGGGADILTDIGYIKLEEHNLFEAKKLFEAALVEGDINAYIPLLHIWDELLTMAEDNESATLNWLFSNLKTIADFSEIAREVLIDEYDIKEK